MVNLLWSAASIAFAALLLAMPAHAAEPGPWALVVTQARAPSGATGTAHAAIIDLGRGTVLPRPLPLGDGGAAPTIALLADGHEAWVTLEDESGAARHHAFQLRPFARSTMPLPEELPATRCAGAIHIPDTSLAYVFVDGDGGAVAIPRGLAVLDPSLRTPRAVAVSGIVQIMPRRHHELGVESLSLEPGALVLRSLDELGAPPAAEFRFPRSPVPPDPDSLVATVSPARTTAALAVSEQEYGGTTRLWLADGDGSPQSLSLPGELPRDPDRAAAWLDDQTLLITTATHDGLTGYQVIVHRDTTGAWTKTWEYVDARLAGPMSVRSDPAGGRALISSGSRLTCVNARGETLWSAALEGPVLDVHWVSGGIVLATGNRVRMLEPKSGAVLQDVPLQLGQVAALAPLLHRSADPRDPDFDGIVSGQETAQGLDPEHPDSDGDDILDGLDPAPTRRSPYLDTPDAITLRAKAIGRELRAWLMRSPNGAPVTWEASADADLLPWLRYYPPVGAADGPVYFGADPVAARSGNTAPGLFRLSTFDLETGEHAQGSPAEIRVSVAGDVAAPRRILWLVEGTDTVDLRSKTESRQWHGSLDYLGGTPHYFSHVVQHAAFTGNPADYTIIVIEQAVAARGGISQKTALEFIAQGGALLFLGGREDADLLPYLDTWTTALGFTLRSRTDARGEVAVIQDGPVSTSASTLPLRVAQAIESSTLAPLTEPLDGGEVFMAGGLGLGRVAVAASDSWLETEGLEHPDAEPWLADLFYWLSQAGTTIADLDGDGLNDDTEDRNGNRSADPGETHFLLADTDGDGLSDGLEDRNRDGYQDPGETDPRNPDSDGDGIWDGADLSAAPVYGAPVIIGLEPSQAPAEGGVEIEIHGERLPQDAQYLLGPRPAEVLDWVSPALVRVALPDAGNDDGGLVDLTVAPNDTRPGAVLKDGFRYEPRSALLVRLAAIDEGTDTRLFELQIAPSEVWRSVTLLALHSPEVSLAEAQAQRGYTIQSYDAPEGVFWTIVNNAPDPAKSKRVAHIEVSGIAEGFTLSLEPGVATSVNGGRIAVEVAPTRLHPRQTESQIIPKPPEE